MLKMKTTILIAIAALLFPAGLFADNAKTAPKTVDLTVNLQDLTAIRDTLAKLDGYSQLDTDKHPVTVPYQFPGHLRLAISDDLDIVAKAIQSYQAAGQAMMKQVGIPAGQKPTDAQTADLNKLWADAAATPKTITLETLSNADLDINDNPIPPTVWAVLKPIRIP